MRVLYLKYPYYLLADENNDVYEYTFSHSDEKNAQVFVQHQHSIHYEKTTHTKQPRLEADLVLYDDNQEVIFHDTLIFSKIENTHSSGVYILKVSELQPKYIRLEIHLPEDVYYVQGICEDISTFKENLSLYQVGDKYYIPKVILEASSEKYIFSFDSQDICIYLDDEDVEISDDENESSSISYCTLV